MYISVCWLQARHLSVTSCVHFGVLVAGTSPGHCRNLQELKLQEQVQRLAVGTIPRAMWVVLLDDLVDTCKPGDDVTIW